MFWVTVMFGLVALKFPEPVIVPRLILLVPIRVIFDPVAVTRPILFVPFESVILPAATKLAVPLIIIFAPDA